MCIYIYVYIYICVCICLYLSIYTCMHVCMQIFVQIFQNIDNYGWALGPLRVHDGMLTYSQGRAVSVLPGSAPRTYYLENWGL